MAKRRANPDVLYADIKQLLETATSIGTAYLKCADEAEAWTLVQKLNRYRQISRNNSVDGLSVYDNWVFKRPNGDTIEISPRKRFIPGNIHIEDAAGNSMDEVYAANFQQVDPLGNLLPPGAPAMTPGFVTPTQHGDDNPFTLPEGKPLKLDD